MSFRHGSRMNSTVSNHAKQYKNSAEFLHMEHIARSAANHLIPTPYGIKYNCGKFKLEYVSNSISFKFHQDA